MADDDAIVDPRLVALLARMPGERAMPLRGTALQGPGELEDPEAAAYGGRVQPSDVLRGATNLVKALTGSIEGSGRSVVDTFNPVSLYQREAGELSRRTQQPLEANLGEFGKNAAQSAAFQLLPPMAGKVLSAIPRASRKRRR